MNTELKIVRAIERLTSLCLQISQGGQHHAFLNFAGHVGAVEVYVHDARRDYQNPQGDALFHRSTYLSPDFGTSADALARLEEMQRELVPYLMQEKAA